MNSYKCISAFLVLALVGLLAVTVAVPRFKEGDTAALRRIKADHAQAPRMVYPQKDIRGRTIPTFDYLIVFPDCKSCSDFRIKARTYMESRPDYVFLILSPDMKGNDDLLTHNRYFVYQFDAKSKYAEIPAGGYKP